MDLDILELLKAILLDCRRNYGVAAHKQYRTFDFAQRIYPAGFQGGILAPFEVVATAWRNRPSWLWCFGRKIFPFGKRENAAPLAKQGVLSDVKTDVFCAVAEDCGGNGAGCACFPV